MGTFLGQEFSRGTTIAAGQTVVGQRLGHVRARPDILLLSWQGIDSEDLNFPNTI